MMFFVGTVILPDHGKPPVPKDRESDGTMNGGAGLDVGWGDEPGKPRRAGFQPVVRAASLPPKCSVGKDARKTGSQGWLPYDRSVHGAKDC